MSTNTGLLSQISELKNEIFNIQNEYIPSRNELRKEYDDAYHRELEISSNLLLGLIDFFVDFFKYMLTLTSGFWLAANSFPVLKANQNLLTNFLMIESFLLIILLICRWWATQSMIKNSDNLRKIRTNSISILLKQADKLEKHIETLTNYEIQLKGKKGKGLSKT